MKRRTTAFLTTVLMLFSSTISPWSDYAGITVMAAEITESTESETATDTGTETNLPKTNLDFMPMEDYQSLGFVGLSDSSQYVDDSYDPLGGYQPQILNELYIGYMNNGFEKGSDDYRGYFTVADNVSSIYKTNSTEVDEAVLNLDSLEDKNISTRQEYYDENDMNTQCVNAIGMVPGNLSEEGAEIRQEILIESRLYVKKKESYHRVQVYSKVNGTWTGGDAIVTELDDTGWVGSITIREQGGFNGLTVGDYDGDGYNEVAVYNPTDKDNGGCIYFYQPQMNDNGTYNLVYDGEYWIKDIGSRFKWAYGETRPLVSMTTTDMAGHDSLVVSVSMPYDTYEDACNDGGVAVIEYKNNRYEMVWEDSLVIENDSSRFKLQNVLSVDLNGDGQEEIFIAGHINTNYKNGDKRGDIDENSMYVNVLVYEEGVGYHLVWNDSEVKKVPRHPDLHVDNSSKTGSSENDPITLSAGKYAVGQLIETIFCEGVFLHFEPDTSAADSIGEIKNGTFQHKESENLEFSNNDEAFVGQIATGCFSETERTVEQTVVIHGHNASGDDSCDVNYTWFYGTHDDNNQATIAQVRYDDYMNNVDEDDNGTCVVLAAVNVDDDSYYMKHVERCYGYSNPGVLGVILSPVYWEEFYYGSELDSAGSTKMTISWTTGYSKTHEGSVGFDAHLGLGCYFEVGADSAHGGFDADFAASYVHSKTRGTSYTDSIGVSAYAGEDKVVLTVVPIVSDYYEMKKDKDSAEELIVVNTTYEPSLTSVDIESYNRVAEAFNAGQSDEEKQLTIIDLDEIYYDGYVAGDPSTYPASSDEILTIPEAEKQEMDAFANITLTSGCDIGLATESSYTKTNGVELSLGLGTHQNYEFGAGLASFGMGGYLDIDAHLTGGYSYTYATTESKGYSYDGQIAPLPSSACTGQDEQGNKTSDYAFAVKMVQWEHIQKTLWESDEDNSEEVIDVAIPYVGYVTTTAFTPPRRVTDLKVEKTTIHSALLQWTKPADRIKNDKRTSVDSYKIYMSESLDGEYKVLQEDGQDVVIDGDTTSYLVSNLKSNTTYFFKIQSLTEENELSVLSEAARGTTLATGRPIITEQPEGMTIELAPGNEYGNGYKFTVGARPYSEDSTLKYQWQKLVDEEWKNIDGATSEVYESETNEIHQSKVTLPEDDGLTVRCVVTEVHTDGTEVSINTVSATLCVFEHGAIEENSKEQTKINVSFYPERTGDNAEYPDYKEGDCYQSVGEKIRVYGTLRTKRLGNAMNPAVTCTGKVYLYDTEKGSLVEGYPKDVTYEGYGNVEFELNDLPKGVYYLWMTFDGNERYVACTSGTSIIYVTEKTLINYELNGGENNPANPTWCNENWSDPLKLFDPVKENAIFEGWYLDSKFTQEVPYSGTYGADIIWPSEIDTNPFTLYAKWTEEYTITYELNGGENAKGNPSVIRTDEVISLEDPTKTGYTFDGWYLDAEYKTPCTAIDGNTKQNVTVYAKWGDPIEYQIQYVLGEGTNAESNPSFYTITSADITFADPVREKYKFEGWYTSMDYTTQVTGIPTGSTGTVVVYAKWTRTTTLDDEDGDGVYEISSYEDLVEMAEMMQYDPDTYAAASYVQTQNINCMLKPWNQGIGSKDIPFEGNYEGNDYYILGLRPESGVMGLFGVIGENGVVNNLMVVDFDYSEPAIIASGFAGINYGTINGCGSGVNLTSAGTIFMYGNENPVAISTLDSDISGIVTAGGLVAVNNGTIKNSRSSANVSITGEEKGSKAGGLAGENTGVLCNVFNTGEIADAQISGGVVGKNAGSVQYGYTNTEVSGTMAGAVIGMSENTEMKDFYYADTMTAACGDKEDTEFTNVIAMALEDMKTSTFEDTLNTAIEGQDLAAWTQNASKNAGYPRLESLVVVQRTLTSPSGQASISGRIHPDAKLVFTKLTNGDTEYLSLQEWLKKGSIKEGWKLALVYEDETIAVWEDDLTIQIKPENMDDMKELAVVYYDSNGEYRVPEVEIAEDTLIMKVDDIGSFAITEASDVKKPSDSTVPGNDHAKDKNNSTNVKSGDSTIMWIYILLLAGSAIALLSLIVWYVKKRNKE